MWRGRLLKWKTSSLAWHSCQVKFCEWMCGENLCEVKIACFCNKSWLFLSFPTILDSSVVEWDRLIHCVHLKRELELLQGFDSLPSLSRCVIYVWLCYVLELFVSGGWYSSCSDTQFLFTQQHICTLHLSKCVITRCPNISKLKPNIFKTYI